MKLDVLKFLPTVSIPSLPSFGSNGSAHQPSPAESVMVAEEGGCPLPPFVPYSAKVPWHSGARGIFSKLFPRYGNYCGPNWSSGRDDGSLLWDKAPVDQLDFCCYKHDMGYDSYDQADLYRADLRFLVCLKRMEERDQRRRGSATERGHSPVAEGHRKLYILGLEKFLIPYRKFLLERVDDKTRKKLTEEEIFGKDRRKNSIP